MVTEYIIGKMAEYMKDIGNKIICMVKDFTNGLMVASMKEIILKTRRMDLEFILIQMAELTKVNGKTENNMEKEFL